MAKITILVHASGESFATDGTNEIKLDNPSPEVALWFWHEQGVPLDRFEPEPSMEGSVLIATAEVWELKCWQQRYCAAPPSGEVH